ncbi:PIR protein [Plasmodium vivax]|uniref:VIR protein n=1 Tax=Plasmodium vivax TaxID=5855 RepID=A0A565A7S9_PLAVI|nr:PIR protein [Plasmodium vivax]
MFSGYHNIQHITFKFYDDSIIKKNRLPSEQRNIDIIRGIKFGEFLKSINKAIGKIFRNKKNKFNPKEPLKYCKHLNYILDFVVQAVKNYNNSIEFFNLRQDFDKNSRDVLNRYTSLECLRDLHNSEDKNLYIKKIMYDLFDDIEYMLSYKNIASDKLCLKKINRIKYRWGILTDIYVAVSDKKIFTLDNNFTFSTIGEKIRGLSCKKTPELPQAVAVAEPQPLADLPNSEGGLLETGGTEDGEEPIDGENSESFDTLPEDLTFSLPVNDDPPKLDTTYAAASLAGVSLFGTILYKYGPFRSRLNSRRGARNGSNIFPIDNNVYDANIMNNFEYLQTGIANGEYQLGYGSVADY